MAIKRAVLDSGVGTRSEAVVTFQGKALLRHDGRADA
jgi:hypothetical protein